MFIFVELISICIIINFIGVLYIVFVMEEAKPRAKDSDKELAVMLPETKTLENGSIDKPTANDIVTNTTNGNMCSNVIKDCFTVIVRKRSGNGRKIVYLILVIVGLSQALDFGITK